MINRGAYVGIMARTEVTTDIPEHAHLANDPDTDWNQRARSLGGTPNNPITTAGEENLLCLTEDRYRGENILVHEFAHGIHLIGIAFLSTAPWWAESGWMREFNEMACYLIFAMMWPQHSH